MENHASGAAKHRTAIVIGASIAGLAAAAALSPHCKSVRVLDRDELPDGPSVRRGAPHSGQFHTLSMGGRLDLETLFPGLTERVKDLGAPFMDPMRETHYVSKCGLFPRTESDMRMLMVTRRTLEWCLRERAGELGNVEILQNATVKDLIVDGDRTTGVVVKGVVPGDGIEYRADLIVDTSGRSSLAPQWMSKHGFDSPPETVINARWGYATTYARVPEDWYPGWTSFYIGPTINGEGRSATRGASMWRQEGNIVVVTAQGCAGDLPPGDEDGFLEWISSFGSDAFSDFLNTFERVESIEIWQNTANRLRDWTALERRPENFVVLGDAAAAFNPIYGQGMAMAARGAKILGSSLGAFVGVPGPEGLTGFAARYQERLKVEIDGAWALSTNSDLGIPGVSLNGEVQEVVESPESEFADRVLALATEDSEVAVKFMETMQMVRKPDWLGEDALRERIMSDWDRLGAKQSERAAALNV